MSDDIELTKVTKRTCRNLLSKITGLILLIDGKRIDLSEDTLNFLQDIDSQLHYLVYKEDFE